MDGGALHGLPTLELTVGGEALEADVLRAVTRLVVHQRLGAPAQCELRLVAVAPALVERFVLGAALSVSLGEALFTGEVTAVELAHRAHGTLDVSVRGYDVLHQLRKRQPVRAHVGVSAASLATELTASLGVTVFAPEPGPEWRHLLQWRQTDFELLVEVAARAGLHLFLHGRELRLLSLAGTGAPTSLEWGTTLLEANVELNAERASAKVTASGWNLRDAVVVEGAAGAPRVVTSGSSPWPAERALVDVPTEDARQLEGSAQAEADRRAAASLLVRGVARGTAALVPGARVRLTGLSTLAPGEFALTEAIHQLDPERGYLTRFSSEPPDPRPTSGAAAATLGIVTSIDGANGRVKVRLPTHASLETEWLQVVSAGAGAGKGLTMLPDVDDVVVLLLAHEDPSQAIVLGGVHGLKGPPDSGVEGGTVQRFSLHTRSGHQVSLDDSKRTLRIQDAAGSSIDFSPEGVTLTATSPLTLDAPGQPIVIRGDRIDFRRG